MPPGPEGPEGPKGPVAPTPPVGPDGPEGPDGPSGPVAPLGPDWPGTPWRPVGPVGPLGFGGINVALLPEGITQPANSTMVRSMKSQLVGCAPCWKTATIVPEGSRQNKAFPLKKEGLFHNNVPD